MESYYNWMRDNREKAVALCEALHERFGERRIFAPEHVGMFARANRDVLALLPGDVARPVKAGRGGRCMAHFLWSFSINARELGMPFDVFPFFNGFSNASKQAFFVTPTRPWGETDSRPILFPVGKVGEKQYLSDLAEVASISGPYLAPPIVDLSRYHTGRVRAITPNRDIACPETTGFVSPIR